MVSDSSNITLPDGRLRCPSPRCDTTIKPDRRQDLERHILSHHLPYSLSCPTPSCHWRGARKDEFKTHSKKYHAGHDLEPCRIYDTKLVLGYILDDGTPLERAEKYALDFVAERALELKKANEWEDLCGRRVKTGRCRCDERDAA
ncbi:hypothetical protein BJV78DRAFT_700477 [Lactifluus subvellereus]|nr:hypothetical protein BJV78DRAFT_700477 [Lactifluus subvellereus]